MTLAIPLAHTALFCIMEYQSRPRALSVVIIPFHTVVMSYHKSSEKVLI